MLPPSKPQSFLGCHVRKGYFFWNIGTRKTCRLLKELIIPTGCMSAFSINMTEASMFMPGGRICRGSGRRHCVCGKEKTVQCEKEFSTKPKGPSTQIFGLEVPYRALLFGYLDPYSCSLITNQKHSTLFHCSVLFHFACV